MAITWVDHFLIDRTKEHVTKFWIKWWIRIPLCIPLKLKSKISFDQVKISNFERLNSYLFRHEVAGNCTIWYFEFQSFMHPTAPVRHGLVYLQHPTPHRHRYVPVQYIHILQTLITLAIPRIKLLWLWLFLHSTEKHLPPWCIKMLWLQLFQCR